MSNRENNTNKVFVDMRNASTVGFTISISENSNKRSLKFHAFINVVLLEVS